MTIDLPDFVPPATTPALVRRDATSVPDVWRLYDPEKADRKEPAADTMPTAVIEAV